MARPEISGHIQKVRTLPALPNQSCLVLPSAIFEVLALDLREENGQEIRQRTGSKKFPLHLSAKSSHSEIPFVMQCGKRSDRRGLLLTGLLGDGGLTDFGVLSRLGCGCELGGGDGGHRADDLSPLGALLVTLCNIWGSVR